MCFILVSFLFIFFFCLRLFVPLFYYGMTFFSNCISFFFFNIIFTFFSKIDFTRNHTVSQRKKEKNVQRNANWSIFALTNFLKAKRHLFLCWIIIQYYITAYVLYVCLCMRFCYFIFIHTFSLYCVSVHTLHTLLLLRSLYNSYYFPFMWFYLFLSIVTWFLLLVF